MAEQQSSDDVPPEVVAESAASAESPATASPSGFAGSPTGESAQARVVSEEDEAAMRIAVRVSTGRRW